MPYEDSGIEQINTDELKEIIRREDNDKVLIDVRENEEYNAGHIPGIKLIPTSEFVERYEQELDQKQAYIFVCRSGNRSQMVCQFLKENGFDHCANYTDGMLGWDGPQEAANLPAGDKKRW